MGIPVTVTNCRMPGSIGLGAALLERFELLDGGEVTLRAGGREIRASLQRLSGAGPGMVGLGQQVMAALGLRAGDRLRLDGRGGALRLGPVVGVLCAAPEGETASGEQSAFLRELCGLGRQRHVLVYLFRPEEVDWRSRMISGHCCGAGWHIRRLPLPDVCYNRFFRVRNPQLYDRLMWRFKAGGIKLVNGRFPDKLTVHSYLAASEEVRPHLPVTWCYAGPSQIAEMLNKFASVYLKPVYGTQGRGIVRVTRSRSGIYCCSFSGGKRVSGPDLASLLDRGFKSSRYLVQQGLNLLHSPVKMDVRVLLQKDGRGCWTVAGMAVRSGRRGAITTNLHTGGGARTLDGVLQEQWPRDQVLRERIRSQIRELALATGRILERRLSSLGELGIDIGIDVSGRVWFIEANPKPGHRSFQINGDLAALRRSRELLLDHFIHLSRFGGGDSDG